LIKRFIGLVDELQSLQVGSEEELEKIRKGSNLYKKYLSDYQDKISSKNSYDEFESKDISHEQENKAVSSEYESSIAYEATNTSYAEGPSKEDKLNRQKLVNALAINLAGATNSHHRVIGLLGEWGSGKSTVLDLLKQRLRELNAEQPFIFVNLMHGLMSILIIFRLALLKK
jgi:ABC-type glutathione transport system ATPase component